MVGHTHEDVNQMFPRVSLYIAKKSVPTISIYDLAIEADNPMPNVQHLKISGITERWGFSQRFSLFDTAAQPAKICQRRG